MHQDEASTRLHGTSHFFADRIVRRDRSTDCDAAVLGNFRRDESDAANVQVAVLLGKTQV
jgi:hypothetical protein